MKRNNVPAFGLTLICLALITFFCPSLRAQNAPQQKAELYVQTGHTKNVGKVAFSPDGSIVASVGGYLDNTIKLWDAQTGQELRTFALEAGGTSAAAFSPDGKIIAAADGDKIHLWSVETGQELRAFLAHTSIVTSVAFSPDGKMLASGSYDSAVKLWSVETVAELRTLSGHTTRVESIAFSPDGKTIASASWDSRIKLWVVETGQEVRTLQTKKSVISVAFSPDGKILASVELNDKTIKLWSAETGQELRTLTGHAERVESVAFTPNGLSLASASRNKTIKLWSIKTGQEIGTLAGDTGEINSVAFSPDRKIIAATEKANKAIKLSSVETGVELRTLSGHTNGIQSVAFAPDGNKIAVGSEDKTVKLWNALTGQGIKTLSGHDGWVISVAFSSDGKTLASGSLDQTIKLWNAETGQELKTLSGKTEGVASVAFSPDGKILASKSNDETIKLWNVETGEQLKSLAYRHPNTRREVFALVPEFRFYRDNNPHTKDKRYNIKFGDNGKLDLYELQTGKLLASLVAFDESDWAVITPDGLFDGSPAAWKLLSWRLDGNTFRNAPVEAFFNEFYRPGLLQDIFARRNIEKPSRDISTIDIRQPEVKVVLSGANQVAANMTTRRATVNVIVKASSTDNRRTTNSGAKDVRLFRNGSLVRVWRGDVLNGKESVRLTATVPVAAGNNLFTAYAFNKENIKSRDGELLVNGADSLKRKGTAYILAIGVNEYANTQYNLKYAVADAGTFSEEIKNQQEKLGRYERVEITALFDREATKPNILRALEQLPQKVQPEDAVFVYFAGHGTAQQNRFYLIPHDLGYQGSRTSVDDAGLKAMLAHSISDRELEAAFEKIDGGQLLLVIDACNSGQALEAEEKRRGPMNSKGLAQLAYEKGMYILTAAQSFQAAQEASQLGHGLLTYALVDEGLKQSAADREPHDGAILLREWLDYATNRVPEMQVDKMKASRNLYFAEEERGLNINAEKRSGQRPRVFYRRELEALPLVVAKP